MNKTIGMTKNRKASHKEQVRSKRKPGRKIPRWEARRLRLRRRLVKTFRRAAPCRELILNTFQELHWPDRIDSPFSKDAHETLRNAVARLNSDTAPYIHFRLDGTCTGVCWDLGRYRSDSK